MNFQNLYCGFIQKLCLAALPAALSASQLSGANITVTTTNDLVNGSTTDLTALQSSDGGDGISLREAIIAANNTTGFDTILLPAGTYTLSLAGGQDDNAASGDLDLLDDLNIVGQSPQTTTINGGDIDRIFEIHDSSRIQVFIHRLSLTRGTGRGAAVSIHGTVNSTSTHLEQVWIHSNHAGENQVGGAIHNDGNLQLKGCLISNNSAQAGAAINNTLNGVLSLFTCTISGNHATAGHAGALFNQGSCDILACTIVNNTASANGGGIQQSGTLTLQQSILSGNSAGATGNNLHGEIISQGHNLIQDSSGASGWSHLDLLDIDPQLSSLQANGGFTMTHALTRQSPAIDQVPATHDGIDQRGYLRNDQAHDIGAFEFAASITPEPSALWLSTKQSATVPQPLNWNAAALIRLGGPDFQTFPTPSQGHFTQILDTGAFTPPESNANVNAIHLVSRDIAVGDSQYMLRRGDILLSFDAAVQLTSSTESEDSDPIPNLNASQSDVVLFRPHSPDDYSSGVFSILLKNLSTPGVDVRGICLIEQNTPCGDTTLEAGDFLFTRSGHSNDQHVLLHRTAQVGASEVTGTNLILLDGSDPAVSLPHGLDGIDLIERSLTLGDQTFCPGTLVLIAPTSSIGLNQTSATDYDLVTLDVQHTTLGAGSGNGALLASPLIVGADLGLTSLGENLDALSLTTGGGNSIAGYSVWAAKNIPAHLDLSFNGDADQDGRLNSLEYALGTQVATADPITPLDPSVSSLQPNSATIHFGFNTEATQDLQWILTRSTDMIQFDPIFRYHGPSGESTAGGDTHAIIGSDSITVTDDSRPAGHAFYRLEVMLSE